MVKEYKVAVSGIKVWADGLKSIFLNFRESERMDFKAGQYVMLKAVLEGKWASRAYSIASTPQDDTIEIIFRVVGAFTKYMDGLKVGDELMLIGPFGHLTLDMAENRKIVCIATGTGVSPLLGMIRDIHKRNACANFDKIVFIYGTKYRNMLVYNDELEAYEKSCGKFEFVPVLSREENWEGKKGHVQNALAGFTWPDADYFVCGLPAMTDEVEKMLLEKGIRKENIHMERY